MTTEVAARVIDFLQNIVGLATQRLANTCRAGHEISTAKIDENQIALCDYTAMATQVSVAASALQCLLREQAKGTDTSLEEALTHIFIAETAHSLFDTCTKRLAEFDLTPATLEAPHADAEFTQFCAEGLKAKKYEQAANLILSSFPTGANQWLSEDHILFRQTFKKFAEDEVRPVAEEIHRQDLLIPESIVQKLVALGCFGLSLPQRYGGFQDDKKSDNVGMVVVTEELSRGSLGVAGSLITRPEILAKALLKGGTEAQRQKFLPQIASGERMVAVAVTEPDFGSDVANIKLSATRTQGGWVLNGCKTWCTFAGFADTLLVLARTDPDLSLKHKGLSLFMVDKPRFSGHDFTHTQDGGGKISGRAIGTIGYRGMHSFECFFDRYFVPSENLIGSEAGLGQGFYLQMAGFAAGRLQTAGRALGVMQAAFEAAVTYAKERKVFARAIADYQLTQYKLARMATLIHVIRQFTYKVAHLMDRGEGTLEASIIKIYASRMAEWVTREAMQIHGGMGYAEEFPVSRYFVDARVFSIFEGAEETLILRVVAKQLLEKK